MAKNIDMNKNNILKGVTWLTFCGIFAKFLGGIYKIMLTRIIGVENIGIYQRIFPVYTFLVVLITSGVPLGISKLISSKKSEEEKIITFNKIKRIFLLISIVLMILLFLIANKLTHIQHIDGLKICYFILAPSIVFSALTVCYKGYFQGKEFFKPSAISNIIEQFTKIIFGLGLSLLFANDGITWQIVGAIIGTSLGDLASLILMKFYYKKVGEKRVTNNSTGKELSELLKIVFPIMLASLILPLSQLVDSFLIVKLLNNNFMPKVSNYLYGLQTGVVQAVISFPTVITFAISTVLLPSLTKDYYQNDNKKFEQKTSFMLKLILSFVIPLTLFVLFYPKQIISILYGSRLNGFNIDGGELSAKLLFWSACNITFLCISQFLSICLQARKKRYLPAFNNLVGMSVKTILELLFVPSTAFNILAFSLASAIGHFTIFILNIYCLSREIKIAFPKKFYLKLFCVNALTIIAAMLLSLFGLSNINFVLIGIFSVILYIILFYKFKILKNNEIKIITKIIK